MRLTRRPNFGRYARHGSRSAPDCTGQYDESEKGYAEREPVHCLASEEGPSGTSVLLECQKCKSQWRENYRFIDDKRTDVSYEFVYDARK